MCFIIGGLDGISVRAFGVSAERSMVLPELGMDATPRSDDQAQEMGSVRDDEVQESSLAIQSADEAQYPDIPTVTGAAVQPTATPYVLTEDEQEKVDEFEDAKTENLRCKLDAAKKVRLRWKRVKHADY
ncbi:MAG: hypothetical protein IJM01_08040, partial [Eubacterium sp.]|nr:hypothetical protein [Eubacterium sp.]